MTGYIDTPAAYKDSSNGCHCKRGRQYKTNIKISKVSQKDLI